MRQEQTRWDLVALAIGAGAVAGLQVGKVPPSLPAMRPELALDMVTAGWAASLFNAVGAARGLFAGAAADRLGAKAVALAGLAMLAGGGFAGALAQDAATLLGARLFEGIGFVAVAVCGPKLIVAASAERQRGLALGAWGVYMPTGMAAAMLAAPVFPGWRPLWLAAAGAAALFLALFAWRMPRAPARQRRFDWAAAGATLGRPGPWLLGGCFGCYSIQWFAVLTWLPSFLIERRGWDAGAAATATALVVAANALGNLASAAAMHRRVGPPSLIATAYLAMAAAAFCVFAPAAPDALLLPAAFLFSGVGGLLPAATLAAAAAEAATPAQVAIAGGVAVQGSNIGSLLGPPAMALVVGALGWGGAYGLNLAAGALGLSLALLLDRRR
jgi:predicted MFS family arabinose efflux permease